MCGNFPVLHLINKTTTYGNDWSNIRCKRLQERLCEKPEEKKLRIDMTPMLDLIFLLITFFVFSTNMTAPTTMDLCVPAPGQTHQATFESGVLTILIGAGGKLSYYEGELEKNGSNLVAADALELRKEIIKRKAEVIANYTSDIDCEAEAVASRRSKEECEQQKMIVMIKTTKDADYSAVVNVLDEMVINKFARYALMEPEKEDLQFFEQYIAF